MQGVDCKPHCKLFERRLLLCWFYSFPHSLIPTVFAFVQMQALKTHKQHMELLHQLQLYSLYGPVSASSVDLKLKPQSFIQTFPVIVTSTSLTNKKNVTKEEVLRSCLVSAVFKSDASCLQVSSSAKNSGQMSLGHTELLPLTYSVLCCSLQHILSLNTPLCSPSPPQSVWQPMRVFVCICVGLKSSFWQLVEGVLICHLALQVKLEISGRLRGRGINNTKGWDSERERDREG